MDRLRKFLSSVAAYFVVTMLLAYPWHVLLFHEKYAAMGAITRAEPIVPFGMLAIVLRGSFFPTFIRFFSGTLEAVTRFYAASNTSFSSASRSGR